MANVTINQLPEVLNINDNTKIPIWQNDATKTVSISSFSKKLEDTFVSSYKSEGQIYQNLAPKAIELWDLANNKQALAISDGEVSFVRWNSRGNIPPEWDEDDISNLYYLQESFRKAISGADSNQGIKADNVYTTVLNVSSTDWDNKKANEYAHLNFLPLSGYSNVLNLSSSWEQGSSGYNWNTFLNKVPQQTYTAITYGNNLFVAICKNNSIVISPDGINWKTISISENNDWEDITYGNGVFVAVSSTGTNKIMTSSDGINWISINGNVGNASLYSITYGNGIFVAVGQVLQTGVSDYRISAISKDGINWTRSPIVNVNPTSSPLKTITYGNGLFVAISDNNFSNACVLTSIDGLAWTKITTIENNKWNKVIYANGIFVAIAENNSNRLMTSPNGADWTARNIGFSASWAGLAYGNGLFVATAVNGINYLLISKNGINWETKDISMFGSIEAITYGNGTFVAVAGQNVIRSGNQLNNEKEKTSDNITQGNKFHYGDLTISGNVSCAGNIISSNLGYEDFIVACSDEASPLTTTVSAVTFRVPFGMYLTSVRASVNVAPVGQSIIVDVKQNNTSLFSTLLSIDANEETSTTAATPAVLTSNPLLLTDDAKIVVGINQTGTTETGRGLKLTLKGYRA